jgi:hypothetical protein
MPLASRRRHSTQGHQRTRLPSRHSSSARRPLLRESPTSPERRLSSGCRWLTTNVAELANAFANLTSQHQDLFIAGGGPTGVVTEVHAAVERVIEACEDQTLSVADQAELRRPHREVVCWRIVPISLCTCSGMSRRND